MIKIMATSVGALLALGISFALRWQELNVEAAIAAGWAQRDQGHLLAQALRQSSDDLTRMARAYAATGDERYRAYFQRILDIRNGVAPRPPSYRLAYWDRVVAAGAEAAPQPAGRAAPLRDEMAAAGFTAAELELLAASEDASNQLTQLENDAFEATRQGDLAAAQALLHSAAYHQAKAQIMLPIKQCIEAMEARTGSEIARLTERRDALEKYYAAATALLALLLLGSFGVALFATMRKAEAA